ncbi:MAG: ABC transporter permease [Deltaproteobacteria bacterium]|nr:ABC transporter permease [Deltaproteobacteria bacterium]
MHINVKKEILGSGPAIIGFVILLVMIMAALLAPLIAPYDPQQQSVSSLLAPSMSHWLGTNHVGQDIWSQLLYGARTSLLVGFSVGALAVLFGSICGVSAALIGGLYERIIMRLVDSLIVIPMIIVIIVIAAYIKPNILVLIVLLSLLSWESGARIIWSQTLSLKERGYIAAARSFGARKSYLAWRHIIPALGPILLVDFIYGIRRAVFLEAGLAFLGISDPATISWGMMMRDALGFSYLNVWQWWLVPTGIALSLTIVGLTFIGHAVEPIIDPRLRGAEVA